MRAATSPAPSPAGPTGGPLAALLVRHAETEWSLSGRHTGRTDIPLTAAGREAARSLAGRLAGVDFGLVLVSPSRRARETCELCGLGEEARPDEDLLEWDYGDYEGLTSNEIHERRPDWVLWRDGCPGGETIEDVARRVDPVIERLRGDTKLCDGDVLVFAHGHVLRVLTARWLGLVASEARRFALGPARIGLLDWEHEWAVLGVWNQ